MKLIVADLDGTLLKRGERELNRNILSSIEYILSNNVAFAVSSGRTYVELKKFFAPFEKDIYFMANDGAITIYKEETLSEFPITKTFTSDSFALHGKYLTYVKTKDALLTRKILKQYHNHVKVLDSNFPDEPIYKITDYTKIKYDDLPLVYEDRSMKEYIAFGVDKGIALKNLLRHLDIPKEECASFGDNLNDIPMFEASGTSCAVANALPAVKKAADKVVTGLDTEIRKLI